MSKKKEFYKIDRYFDDHYEKTVEENLSIEEARELVKKYPNGNYVSYQINQMPKVNTDPPMMGMSY